MMIQFSDPYVPVFVIYSAIVLILLSWLLLLISKVIFKEYFTNKFWKVAFYLVIVAPSLVQIYLASFDALGGADVSLVNTPLDLSGHPTTDVFDLMFFPLFTAFFLVYLIYFLVRLGRYRKHKTSVQAGKNEEVK